MKSALLLSLALLTARFAGAQTFAAEVAKWQHHYKAEFLTDDRSPVKAKDTGFLRFFPAGPRWRVTAAVTLTPDAPAFDMATHSGRTKRFRQYAIFRFSAPGSYSLPGRAVKLHAYERVDRPASDTLSAVSLFIPFTDLTSGGETYGGGRYMDLKKADIQNGSVILDFNKAYNPYCAFGEGFSCPIPPAENRLAIAVKAGEKLPVPPLLKSE